MTTYVRSQTNFEQGLLLQKFMSIVTYLELIEYKYDKGTI
jgi:hypothetical protein